MRLLIEKIPDIQSLYMNQLRLLLSAEAMIAIKTPHLLETATDSELQQVFQHCIEGSEARAAQIRRILSDAHGHGDSAHPLKCKAIYVLFDEAEELIEECAHDSIRNIGMIAAALRIKHYQIAVYSVIRQFAQALGREQDLRLFDDALHDDSYCSRQLVVIAERANSASGKIAA
jgi:ferritin-like metal-binding protein YciE